MGREILRDRLQSEREGIAMYKTIDFDKCHAQLKGTAYHTAHGISADTCERFNIGFDSNYLVNDLSAYPPQPTSWEALIIPTGTAGHIAINTADGAHAKNRKRVKGAGLFNIDVIGTAQKPVFITCDVIDALSIIDAGGEAVALEDKDNATRAQLEEITRKYIAVHDITHPLILSMGEYTEAQELAGKLADIFTAQHIDYYTADITSGSLIINNAYIAQPDTFKEAIAKAEALEEQHTQEARETYINQSAYNHIEDFINGISASANTPAIKTGFDKLDTVLDGGLYEGLYICGAVTSLGKTTLIMQIADNIAGSGSDVLIFSLEMARAELMSKSISRYTLLECMKRGKGTNNAKTARGITDGARYTSYSDTEREIIKQAVSDYKDIAQHIYIHEGIGDISTDFIRAQIKEHIRHTGTTPVVIVDYLQILAPHDYRATDKQSTDRNVTELKRISRDYKTPVIGVSSFNREGYGGAVSYKNFKESGAIEYGSDVLIGLQLAGAEQKSFDSDSAIKKDPRKIELVIMKNRQGKIGERVAFNYYPMFNYFEETQEAPVTKTI